MSMRQPKCPRCKSTSIDQLRSDGEIDQQGKQPWLVVCRGCNHSWCTTLRVEFKRFVNH